MLEIKGSVAVITGGGSGVGEAVARYWAENGGHVVLGDIAPEALSRVENELRQIGANIATCVCDVTKEEDNTALAELAVDTLVDVYKERHQSVLAASFVDYVIYVGGIDRFKQLYTLLNSGH